MSERSSGLADVAVVEIAFVLECGRQRALQEPLDAVAEGELGVGEGVVGEAKRSAPEGSVAVKSNAIEPTFEVADEGPAGGVVEVFGSEDEDQILRAAVVREVVVEHHHAVHELDAGDLSDVAGLEAGALLDDAREDADERGGVAVDDDVAVGVLQL